MEASRADDCILTLIAQFIQPSLLSRQYLGRFSLCEIAKAKFSSYGASRLDNQSSPSFSLAKSEDKEGLQSTRFLGICAFRLEADAGKSFGSWSWYPGRQVSWAAPIGCPIDGQFRLTSRYVVNLCEFESLYSIDFCDEHSGSCQELFADTSSHFEVSRIRDSFLWLATRSTILYVDLAPIISHCTGAFPFCNR